MTDGPMMESRSHRASPLGQGPVAVFQNNVTLSIK